MLLLLLLDGWMSIENKIPTSLRKSQQVKADCSCWMKSMNLETASLPLYPLSPLLPPHCFLFSFGGKEKWEICHDFSRFHNLHLLFSPLICFFFSFAAVFEDGSLPTQVHALLVMVSKINKSARKSRRWEDYWLSILMQFYSFYGFFFFFLVEIRNHNQQSSRENMKWEPKLSSAVSSILIVCFYNGAVRCVPLCLSGNLGRDMKILNPRPIKTSLERR